MRNYYPWWINFVHSENILSWPLVDEFLKTYSAKVIRDTSAKPAGFIVFENEEDMIAFKIKYVYG